MDKKSIICTFLVRTYSKPQVKAQKLSKKTSKPRQKRENSSKKLKTQAKNWRFRQNQKHGLPKIGRKKKPELDKQKIPVPNDLRTEL